MREYRLLKCYGVFLFIFGILLCCHLMYLHSAAVKYDPVSVARSYFKNCINSEWYLNYVLMKDFEPKTRSAIISEYYAHNLHAVKNIVIENLNTDDRHGIVRVKLSYGNNSYLTAEVTLEKGNQRIWQIDSVKYLM